MLSAAAVVHRSQFGSVPVVGKGPVVFYPEDPPGSSGAPRRDRPHPPAHVGDKCAHHKQESRRNRGTHFTACRVKNGGTDHHHHQPRGCAGNQPGQHARNGGAGRVTPAPTTRPPPTKTG